MQLTWLGHSSFLLKTNASVMYIDPAFEPSMLPIADVILLSHFHPDHVLLNTVSKLRGEQTLILGTKESSSEILGCHTVYPGEKHVLKDIEIQVVQAYSKQHPRSSMIGFLVKSEGKTVYYASDSAYIPEMLQIKCDVMIVAVGGTFTMKPKEAAEAVKAVHPLTAIPMHYGRTEGTRDSAELFKEYVESIPGTNVLILDEGKEVVL